MDTFILMFEFFRLQRSNCTARPCPPATRKAGQMPVSLKPGSFCGKSGGWSDSQQEEQRRGRPEREGGKWKISTWYPPMIFLISGSYQLKRGRGNMLFDNQL